MAVDYDAFLSFARADEALGTAIGRFLRASGLRVAAVGELDFAADVPWLAGVERAVSRSRKLVVVISNETPAGWLRAELDFAGRQLHLEVIPLIREGFSHSEDYPALSLFTPMRLPGDRRLLDQRLEGLVNRVQREGSPLRPAIDREARPFPSLRPFGVHDGRWFFGRSRELADATTGLGFEPNQSRWLRIEGAAGMGKTSFARAGVVDAVLRGSVNPGPDDWFAAAFRPGSLPFPGLVAALGAAFKGRLAPGEVEAALGAEGLASLLARTLPERAGLLLVIDHLDDVAAAWEQGASDVEAFDLQIAGALAAPTCRMLLLTTSQSGQSRRTLDVLPKMAEQIERTRVVALGGFSRPSIRSIIEQPLQMVGRHWPAALVDRIVEDASRMAGAPGALCWMLDRLLGDKTPSEAVYEALGGLWNGPGRALDARLAVLDDAARTHALTLILSLIDAGRGRGDLLPGQPFAEAVLVAGGGKAGEDLVRGLTRGAGPLAPDVLLRLDPDGTHVRLAHADLLRVWPRLRGLLASYRNVLERRTDIERAARAWHAATRSPALLPVGGPLTRDLAGDFSGSDQLRLRSILSATGRAYVRATELAEEAREAATSAGTELEKAHQTAERAAERGAAAGREDLWRRRAFRRGVGALFAAGLATLLGTMVAQRQGRLTEAVEEIQVLTAARNERDGAITNLRQEKATLIGERETLTDGMRRLKTQAQQAAAEAEQLLEHSVQAASLADDHISQVGGAAGLYARRMYFSSLVEALEARVNAHGDHDRLRLLFARLLIRLGDVLSVTGPSTRAGEAFARATQTLQTLVSRQQPAPAYLVTLAEASERAAEFHLRNRAAGREPSDAVPHLEQAIEIWKRLIALYPQQPGHQIGIASARVRLSQVLVQLNNLEGGRAQLRLALDVTRRIAEGADKNFDRAYTQARWLGQLAELETRANALASARDLYIEGGTWLDRAEPLAPDDQKEAVAQLKDRFRIRAKGLTP